MSCRADLYGLKNIGIEQCARDQLVDLRSVSIDKALPVPERMSTFVKQIKNPYLFKVDAITVKVEFSSGTSLEDSLLSFLLAEKSR